MMMGDTTAKRREREWAEIEPPQRPKCARCGAGLRVSYTRRVENLRKVFCDCQVCELMNVYVEGVEEGGSVEGK